MTKGWSSLKVLTTKISTLLLILSLTACYGFGNNRIDPNISYTMSDWQVQSMPSALPPLTEREAETQWGQEYTIGQALAKEFDLYRAVTAFKRAEILVPKDETARKQEIQYCLVLSYYLGHRYEDAIDAFNKSLLTDITRDSPLYSDLLILLYESYGKIGDTDRANHMLVMINEDSEPTADKLAFAKALTEGDIEEIVPSSYSEETSQQGQELVKYYDTHSKSARTAQALNAICPGAGYLYVGQKQTAITAFLLNGLCIAASAYFFLDGNIAAGAIMTGFEAGWYFGGIYGAGEAAKTYNERLYEHGAHQVMRQNEAHPVLNIKYAF